jgi:DNA-binding MarR family transcriptional regulator
MDKVLRSLGLTAPQYAVLSVIELDPGISSAALARAAFVTAQTMQGIVANLERAGLLKRRIDPSHGRILRGELTKKGAKILREAHTRVKEIEAITFGSLTPAEIESLTTRLIACAEALDQVG